MSCLDEDTVLRLVEGGLPPAALAGVDAHLDGCPTCRDVVSQVARIQAPAGSGVLARGQVIGRYVIGDLLGAGAMGRVYSAWEPELDRRVAIKVLRDPLPGAGDAARGASAGARQRLVREAQAMAKLAHPNVVTVHEVGIVEDAVFVAMELVDGQTLRAWRSDAEGGASVRSSGRSGLRAGAPGDGRPWRDVAAVLVEVARGLAAVHAAGVVHRDVKPDNIIVGADGRARLGDFGLARTHGARTDGAPPEVALAVGTLATGTGAVAGTPAYMAPEVLRGGAADAATDQFSFGVTAWEVLHGERPFAGDSWAALLDVIEDGAIRDARVRVPGWLDAIVRRCLAVDPTRRFPSLRAVADALAAGLVAPRRPAGVWIAAGAGVIAAASAAAYLAVARDPGVAETCDGGADEIATVWKAPAAGLGTGAARALEAWAGQWATARDANCRLAQTEPHRASVRDRCLVQRRAELAALLARPATPTANVGDALLALPAPDECRFVEIGTADPAPMDAARADDVRHVERELPAVRAAIAVGDARGALAPSAALVERARASGHAPTLAQALLVDAAALRGAGRLDAAVVAARDAVAAAERGHDDATAATAWVERVSIAGDRRDLAAAEELAVIAEAAVDRAGAAPHLAARLVHLRGLVAYNRGQLADARRLLEDARARRVKLHGEDSVEVGQLDSALGQLARSTGELDVAERHLRRALAIDTARRGAQHPAVALDLHNIAGVLRLRDDLDGALALYRESLAVHAATGGSDSIAAGLTHNSLGLVLIARKDWHGARGELEQARGILTAAHHGDRAMAEHNLGLVEQQTGRHAKALEHFAVASTVYTQTVGDRTIASVRLLVDRARSELAVGRRAAARELAEQARVMAWKVDGAAFVADDAERLVAKAGPARPPAPAPKPPPATPTPTPKPKPDVGVYGSGQSWGQ